jgi:hypothetical protein
MVVPEKCIIIFVAVRSKNETVSISYLDTGHANMSRSQTSNRDLN